MAALSAEDAMISTSLIRQKHCRDAECRVS